MKVKLMLSIKTSKEDFRKEFFVNVIYALETNLKRRDNVYNAGA